MTDWDVILAPEDDDDQDDQDDQENDAIDGVYFGDGGDNDSFGTPGSSEKNNDNAENNTEYPKFMGNEPQSFNPRMISNDLYDSNENANLEKRKIQNQQHNQQPNKAYRPPQAQSGYSNLPNTYSSRKIHDSPEIPAYKNSKRRGRSRGPRGGHHMTSDSDSPTSFIASDLLKEGGFDENTYIDFHDAALQQRAELGIGKSNEMKSLFYFWCYYLRGHFDQSMYDEFLDFARQDASENSHYGIECYFRLCSYGLEQRWDPQVFAQFQDEALVDYKRGSTYGIEKVKGFLENHKYNFEIKPTPEMEATLAKFPTFESFKQDKNNHPNNQNNHQPRNRKTQFEDTHITEASSIPKQTFLGSNITLGGSFKQNTNSPSNSNNYQSGGSRRRGGATNNPPNNFNRHRGGGNQNRKQQFRHKNDEPREWTFGKMQPSSAPKPNNMNLDNQNH